MGNKKTKTQHNKVFEIFGLQSWTKFGQCSDETGAGPRQRNRCPNSRRFLAGPACNLFSNRSTRFNFYDTDHAKSTTGWTSRQNHASWAGTVWVCVANSAFTIQIAINQPQIEYCADIVHSSQFLLWGYETQFKFYDMNYTKSIVGWRLCWDCKPCCKTTALKMCVYFTCCDIICNKSSADHKTCVYL